MMVDIRHRRIRAAVLEVLPTEAPGLAGVSVRWVHDELIGLLHEQTPSMPALRGHLRDMADDGLIIERSYAHSTRYAYLKPAGEEK